MSASLWAMKTTREGFAADDSRTAREDRTVTASGTPRARAGAERSGAGARSEALLRCGLTRLARRGRRRQSWCVTDRPN